MSKLTRRSFVGAAAAGGVAAISASIALADEAKKDEAAQAENAVKLLGGRLSAVKEFSLGENDRRVIIIDKISPISQKYPRQSGKIKKSPI